MEEERLADMVVVEYGPTEMDITVCVTELGGGAHTPAAGPITNYQLHHYWVQKLVTTFAQTMGLEFM